MGMKKDHLCGFGLGWALEVGHFFVYFSCQRSFHLALYNLLGGVAASFEH